MKQYKFHKTFNWVQTQTLIRTPKKGTRNISAYSLNSQAKNEIKTYQDYILRVMLTDQF